MRFVWALFVIIGLFPWIFSAAVRGVIPPELAALILIWAAITLAIRGKPLKILRVVLRFALPIISLAVFLYTQTQGNFRALGHLLTQIFSILVVLTVLFSMFIAPFTSKKK